MQSMTRKNLILIAIALFIFASIKLILLFWWNQQQTHTDTQTIDSCSFLQEGCRFDKQANFKAIGLNNAKSPFTLQAQNVSPHVKSIEVSFQMKGMDMGFNRFNLKPQGEGVWQLDRVYLPLCVAGRHDWLVIWKVDGQTYQAEFELH